MSKLLVVTRSIPLHADAGGMEQASWDLARQWVAAGQRVEILTTPVPGKPAEFEHQGLSVTTIKGAVAGRYSMRWWLGSARRDIPPGTEIVFSISAGATSMAWLRRGPSYVFQLHGTAWANARSLLRNRERLRALKVARMLWWVMVDLLTYWRIDCVVAVSSGVAEQLRNPPYGWLWSKTKLTVIPNGVDTEFLRPNQERRDAARARYGFDVADTVAITVSRLDRQKAVDRCAEALACGKGTSTRLLVVGSGPEEENLRRLVVTRGLVDRVVFTGRLDHDGVAAALSAADVFVFPVRGVDRESLPTMSVLEALAAALPVIVPEESRWPDDLTPLLQFVDVSDPAALADAIEASASTAPRL